LRLVIACVSNWAGKLPKTEHAPLQGVAGHALLPADALGADSRRCQRPDQCPFVHHAPGASWDLRRWARVLTDVIPGDPDLVIDLLGVLEAR
jgi:hypothetical protein